MTGSVDASVREQVAGLLEAVGARAAGYWRVEGNRLEQVAFAGAPTLPATVAQAFAAATVSVPIDRTDFGIVAAAVTGTVKVSRASELAPEGGSGYWLRAFGASRSVAVPLRDASGTVRAVVAASLPDNALDDAAVARRIVEVCGSGEH